jgi:hypothetical protein
VRIELPTNKITELATGFDPKVYFRPINEKGNYFLALSEKKFYKHNGKKLELVADIDIELGKSGYPVLRWVYISTNKLVRGSDIYAFSFYTDDSTNLSGTKPFFNLPEFCLFNTKTGKLGFFGKRAAPSKKTTYYAGSHIYNDACKQRILTCSVGNATISAYTTDGKLLAQSSLPDSIRNDFRMLDEIPKSKYKNLSYNAVANLIAHKHIDDYYLVEDLVRLNDNFISLSITNGRELVYLVFDNDLQFKGYFEEPYILRKVAYYDGHKTTFQYSYKKKIKTVRIY